jgi:carboxypeptidase family protein/TonB-dependent receptor-like protein
LQQARNIRFVAALMAGTLLVFPTPRRTAAQSGRGKGGIVGHVTDQATHAPIGLARAVLLGTRHDTASDSVGRFVHQDLSPGTYLLQVRALGYSVTTSPVQVKGGEVLDLNVELIPLGYTLDTVAVEGRASFMEQRLREFDQRRAEGRGVYFTEADIQRHNAGYLSDLLRTVPGIRTICNSVGCGVSMTRAARGSCRPDYIVDGLSATNSTTGNLLTQGVVGVEVYRSLSETPAQFLKAGATCGVIVIWTRSAPSP